MQEEFLAELIGLPNTYIGEQPVGVNNCQTIKVGGGRSDAYFGLNVLENALYTVYIRGTSHAETKTRCNVVYKTLQNWHDSFNKIIIKRMPSFVGTDSKFRFTYAFQIKFITGGE